ncbi:3'-5' exonuclease DinG [subsurface metagenome]
MEVDIEGRNPVEIAQEFLKRDPVILDTETTGLKGNDEIIEIAVVNMKGKVLFNSLVKPVKLIPAAATSIHGITDQAVRNAPNLDMLWEGVRGILYERPVGIYNSNFDLRLIRQSLDKYGIKLREIKEVLCIMKLYAIYSGVWDDYHDHYRWFKLEEAARRSNLSCPANIHRALADAELTRRLMIFLAS